MAERNTRERYSHKIADEKKRVRREQALTRQAARDGRSSVQQIVLIKQRSGNSTREIARLTRKV